MKEFSKSAPKGASLVEYGLLVGLVAVVAIGSVSGLGREVSATFGMVQNELSGSMSEAAMADDGAPGAGTAGGAETVEPQGPTGPGAASLTITSGQHPQGSYLQGYRSAASGGGFFGSLDSYEGAYPGFLMLEMNTNHDRVTMQVDGDFRAEIAGHVLTCDDGLNLAIDDAAVTYSVSYDSLQARWTGITENWLAPGTQISCELSN